ncbi:MAG: sporulation protein [Candidatus Thorarchaeota archaeon]
MRKIEIKLDEEPLLPGGKVEGYVLVTCDDDFQCERLYVSLFGDERSEVVFHAGKVTIVYREDREHVNEVRDLAECLMVPMGESRYEFSFTLPTEIPGSYKGSYGWIKYALEAKAEVSWAKDPKSKIELSVGFTPRIDDELTPQTISDIIEDEGMTIAKVETSKDRFLLGDNVDFRFFIDREVSMRGVRAEILRCEHVEPKGYKVDSKKTLAEIYFPEEEFRRDSWIEGVLPTDTTWIESFTSELIEYSHILKITLDVARRRDKVFEIPIVLKGQRNRDHVEFDY